MVLPRSPPASVCAPSCKRRMGRLKVKIMASKDSSTPTIPPPIKVAPTRNCVSCCNRARRSP